MSKELTNFFESYVCNLSTTLAKIENQKICELVEAIQSRLASRDQIFICGNGGSAGNAIHLVNDFVFGLSTKESLGLRAHALPANISLVTCLANDIGYPSIFSEQLSILANPTDLLIVFSGSGNSANIVEAIYKAKEMGMSTAAILGYDGGVAKSIVDIAVHAPVDDMQISEDIQLIVGHMIVQWLRENLAKEK